MKHKGQGLVEFAVVAPFLILLGIAIIYLGALFMDYTQYSNAARDAARDIALQSGSSDQKVMELRNGIANGLKNDNAKTDWKDKETQKRYAVPLTGLYKPTWDIKFYKKDTPTPQNTAKDAVDVEVTIELTRQAQVGSLLAEWGILPQELKPIKFRMALEKSMIVRKID